MQNYVNPPKRHTYIIWDWNGTLLDDAWLCVEVMSEMLREHGLPVVDLEKYRGIFDFPVKDYYRKLGFDFGKIPFEIVGMDFMVRYNKRQKECKLHEDVQEVIKEISSRGYKQCILSAREQQELTEEVTEMGLSGYFQYIFGTGDHYAHGKTERAFELLKALDTEPPACLFIGDTVHDADVARETGFDCILIPNGHHHHSRLLSCGYPVADSLKSLLSVI